MDKKLWERLAAAAIWFVLVLGIGTVLVGAWDDGIREIYKSWNRTPPTSFTEWALKLVIIAAVTLGFVTYYWPTITSLIPSPKPQPREPSNTINLYQLMPRVVEAWERSRFGLPRQIPPLIYDRLRTGDLRAWGRRSKGYPSRGGDIRPSRQSIDPSFWAKNTIEELDYWVANACRFPHTNSVSTTTAPAKASKDRLLSKWDSVFYWDLVFDDDDTSRLWPSSGSWMAR